MKQTGLELDIDIANRQVGRWLHDVAYQRIHGTTKQKPEVLLIKEKLALGELPATPILANTIAPINHRALPIESFQHTLSTCDQRIDVAL